MKGFPMSVESSLCDDAIERKERCHLPLENCLTQLVLCLLGRCSRGVSVSNEESGDELGSGDVVVGVEAVGVRVRGLRVKGLGVRVCLLELLGFWSRLSSASEGSRSSTCDG